MPCCGAGRSPSRCDDSDPERAYPHLAELGVKWAFCQNGWFRTEPRKGIDDFKWSRGGNTE